MTINMNGMRRESSTGHVNTDKPGGDEAERRDRIDTKATQWLDSSSRRTRAQSASPRPSPGPTGRDSYSHEDAHTILAPPPRWDPDNATVGPVRSTRRPGPRVTTRRAPFGAQWRPPQAPAASLRAVSDWCARRQSARGQFLVLAKPEGESL